MARRLPCPFKIRDCVAETSEPKYRQTAHLNGLCIVRVVIHCGGKALFRFSESSCPVEGDPQFPIHSRCDRMDIRQLLERLDRLLLFAEFDVLVCFLHCFWRSDRGEWLGCRLSPDGSVDQKNHHRNCPVPQIRTLCNVRKNESQKPVKRIHALIYLHCPLNLLATAIARNCDSIGRYPRPDFNPTSRISGFCAVNKQLRAS